VKGETAEGCGVGLTVFLGEGLIALRLSSVGWRAMLYTWYMTY